MVKLADIRIENDTQTRAEINDATIADYMLAMIGGAKFPAIILYDDGAVYRLADGAHRYQAAQALQHLDILAEVRPGSRIDAVRFALGANITNGLPRTNNDKRRCVKIALHEFADHSDRVIAGMCGVSHPFVAEVRAQLVTVTSLLPGAVEPNAPSAKTMKRVGKDGKSRRGPTRASKAVPTSDGSQSAEGFSPSTPEKPTAVVPTEPINPTMVTAPEPNDRLHADTNEQHTTSGPVMETYRLADGSLANLPAEGFLTVAQITNGLAKLKVVAKKLDGGTVSSALVSKLERGFLIIMAAVFEIADADADQADKDGAVELLGSVADAITLTA